MTESFDDFARKHAGDKENRARLKDETKPEWAMLRDFVAQFARNNKGIGDHSFEWATAPSGRPMLVLNNVAAIFEDDGNLGGVPQNTRVRFTRKPAGPGRMYPPGRVPLDDETWDLEAAIAEGEFAWSVPELAGHYSAAHLAEEVAKKLAQYHIDYEKAYSREV